MEELINMIATDSSAVDISDQIKDLLYQKAAGKVDTMRQPAAASLFGEPTQETEDQE
tara:strand:+ start:770 stop:940 length:171 start_codon:yes stop_codon:yes gene_type:complete